MQITARLLSNQMTQAEVDRLANSLVMSPHEFSEIACLDGRMAGVITECDTCLFVFNE